MTRFVVVALATTVASRLSAQHLRAGETAVAGTVVEATTGQGVGFARARLVELQREEQTHTDGTFHFERLRPGTYTLSVQRLGFRAVTQRVEVRQGEVTTVRVSLTPAAIQLAPSVVTGTVRERGGEEMLSPTTTLSGAELDRSIAPTVAASLQGQPGVTLTSLGPATARPVIRGLGGDRILVLEDGQRPGDMSAMSGDHAVAVDPFTARQVDVVRGPMSLLYGSSALGGIINVVRDEIPTSVPDHPHGALSVQGSSVTSGGSVGGFATTALGPFAVRADGSATRSDDVRTPIGRLVNTDAATNTASLGGAYAGGWGHAGASYRYYANDYGIPGGFVGGHETGVDIEMRRHSFKGETAWRPSSGSFELEVSGAFSDYGHSELEPSGDLGTRFDQQMASADAVARHPVLGPFALGALGARFQYRDITTGGTLRTPSTRDVSAAGFLVEELGTGALRLQVGGRFDWARFTPREEAFIDVGGARVPVRTRTFASWSGALGLLHSLGEGVRAGVSASRAYRTPDFNELYSNGPHLAANSFDVGDPNLDEETGFGLDAFVRLSRSNVSAEVAVFRNQLDKYVFPSSRGRAELGTQGGRPRFQYTNEDAAFSGAEGRVEWSLTSTVIADATVSLVQARFTSARDSIPVITATDTTFVPPSRFPPFIPPLSGQVGLRYESAGWYVGTTVRATDRQDRLGDFEEPTAGFALVDFGSGVRFVRGDRLHAVTLRVENAFDREHRDHVSRIKAIMPEPGRNISLLYRLTF